MQIEMPHPTAGKVALVGSPMRFTNAPITHERHPPLLGEHTAEVLAELGITNDSIAALRARGVV